MVWVKSEYADELAVVSAWLAVLLPWDVSYGPDALADASVEGGSGAILVVRWPLGQVRYIFGVPFADAVRPAYAWDVHRLYPELDPFAGGFLAWYAGASLVVFAGALGVAMYADEQRVAAALPVPAVRIVGGLLGLAAATFAVATALLYSYSPFEIYPLPFGLVVLAVLAASLLRVDLVADGANDGDADPGAEASSQTDRA